jgi:cytochrome oxidase assembly protein ShyY1
LIWVQRGWVMRDMRGRNVVPVLATPSGLVVLHGQLQGQPSALSNLGADRDERTSTGAALRLNINWPAALQLAGAGGQVLPFTLRESEAGQGDGLGRNWDAPPLGIAKHQGYAFQWAGMGLTLLLLYLWFQCWQPWRRLRAQDEPSEQEI